MESFIYLTFMLIIGMVHSIPFELQEMRPFPDDMALPKAQALYSSGVKGGIQSSNPLNHFEPDALPNSPDEDFNINYPFDKCEKHLVSYNKTVSPQHLMEENDVLAFFPMEYIKESIPTIFMNFSSISIYKVLFDGSSIYIHKCDNELKNCVEVASESTKGRPYITSSQWNYIYTHLLAKEVQINVNNKTSLSFECEDHLMQKDQNSWYFGVELVDPQTGSSQPETISPEYKKKATGNYVTQYPCSEYKAIDSTTESKAEVSTSMTEAPISYTDRRSVDATTEAQNPQFHTGDDHLEEPTESNNGIIAAIVIGTVFFIILIAIAITIAIKFQRQRSSANISQQTNNY